MASVNKVIIVGNCGRDPETRYSADGAAITNVSIATTSQWKDKASGDKREETEWHRVAFFGRLAEIAGEYLKKGSPVYVEGRLRTRKWQDKDGQERFTTEIVAENMQLLGSRGDRSGGGGGGGYDDMDQSPPPQRSAPARSGAPGGGGSRPASGKKPVDGIAGMDDDIPF